jgi:hypothetical protein
MILVTTNTTAINDSRTVPPTGFDFLFTLFDYPPTIS